MDEILRAVPPPECSPLSCTAIHRVLDLPPVHLADLREVLVLLSLSGEVETLRVGGHTYYRKKYNDGLEVAPPAGRPYNPHTRSKSSLDSTDYLLHALTPLRAGRAVALWMDTPRRAHRKNARSHPRQVVVLSPGPMLGLPKGTVLVSVVGSGSCFARVDQPQYVNLNVADLVLAGIPAKLANVLMRTLQRAMQE